MSYGKQIFGGVVWTTLQTVINRSFGFFIKLYLAKVLLPNDFGLIGMAAVFIGFIQVFTDLGMGAGLIQKKEDQITENHYNTVFWTGIGWSVFIFLCISFLIAPLVAQFYNEPQLRSILPVLCIGILASPVNVIHVAQLNKALNFKKLAFINNSSSIFSGILSIALAYMGAGVWSLVFNSVSAFLIAMPLYFMATKWTPKLHWDKKSFKDIFSFGVYTTGSGLFSKLIANIDYLIVGKLFGAYTLGIYTFAFTLTDTFRGQLMGIIKQVMFPVFSKIQQDKGKVVHYYTETVRYNSFLVVPIMVFIFAFAGELLPYLYGDKWNDAVIVIKFLSVSVIIQMFANSNLALYRGIGRPDLEFKILVSSTLFMFVPCIALGGYFYGLLGVCVGLVVARILYVTQALIVTNRVIDASPRVMIGINLKYIVLSAIPYVVILAVDYFLEINVWIKVTLYLVLLAALFLTNCRKEINLLKNFKKNVKVKAK